MPFATQFNEVYKAIKSAVEGGEVCFHCTRADDFLHGGSVMEDILGAIGRAEIIVADLTTRNPNVFYELGIAHTVKLEKKVILIMQGHSDSGNDEGHSDNDVPFDVSPLRRIPYDANPSGLEELKAELIKAFSEVGEYSWQFPVRDGGSYEKDQDLFGFDRHWYRFGLSEVKVGKGGGATFRLNIRQVEGERQVESPKRETQRMIVGEEQVLPGLGWKLELLGVQGDTARFGVGRPKSKRGGS